MFSGEKGIQALSIFKWKQQSSSSLTAGLLNDVPPEIELSTYNSPSPGSESPSGLLDGDNLNSEAIDDLDLFIERVYSYRCEKGLWCFLVKCIFELLSLGFTIVFSAFFLLFVDWNGLRNAKCGMDAVESGIKPCDLAKEALHKHPLTPLTLSKALIVGYLGILSVYWIFSLLRLFTQLKEFRKVRHFFKNSLNLTDNEILTMPWPMILEKIVQVQHIQQLCVVKDLSAHDMVMRLMRKENYLIGMLNKGVLAFPLSKWVPGSCATGKVGTDGIQYRLVLPKTLEWTLNWCILQSMFDRNFRVRRDFVSDPKTLKKRLMIVGLVMLLLSPFLVIFMLVYLFLRHAEQFYNHPSTASSRRWSNLSKWMFREFNEVDHLFKHRMVSSLPHASDYLKQFPSPILTIVAKFISFVSGGFAAVLIIIAFLEESLLEGHIFGRNLFWYAAVFGTITAISRAAMMDDLLVLDPQGAMSMVVQHSHYMPKRWRGKENTEAVRMEFETLFQYTGMMLLEEITSIFLTPYLLLFVVPKRVDDILKFITDFTVDVEGVGHVCSFSLFDFKNHGNKRYCSPFNSTRDLRSSQGKLEKSFLSFKITYPFWEPNDDGKQFLASLKMFRDQNLGGRGTAIQQMPHRNSNFKGFGFGERNSSFSRESPYNNPGYFQQFDSMWLIDVEQKNYPYILEWYYTSQNHERDADFRNTRSSHHDNEDNPHDLWIPSHLPKYDDKWAVDIDDLFEDRINSTLEASTSAPLFQESVLQHRKLNDFALPTLSPWWDRAQQQGPDQATSFLEPPNFYHETYDNISRRSIIEEEGLDLRASRGLSRTFYMDDEGGDFNLPFVDIYRRESENDDDNEDSNPLNQV